MGARGRAVVHRTWSFNRTSAQGRASRAQPWHSRLVVLSLVALIFLYAVACEKSEDRTLIINGRVHVYKTEVPPATYPGTEYIAELGPNDHPKVLEVRSGSGYRAVKIQLTDGREGWVFSGEHIELH